MAGKSLLAKGPVTLHGVHRPSKTALPAPSQKLQPARLQIFVLGTGRGKAGIPDGRRTDAGVRGRRMRVPRDDGHGFHAKVGSYSTGLWAGLTGNQTALTSCRPGLANKSLDNLACSPDRETKLQSNWELSAFFAFCF
jgi:hypothetical protein